MCKKCNYLGNGIKQSMPLLPHNVAIPSMLSRFTGSFPCTSHSYSSFLFLSASGYRFPLKSAKHSVSVVPTLCHPMNHSPPGSSVHGILQAEYWSGLPFPSPGDLPHPGIKPGSPTLEADSLLSELQGKP